MLHSISHFLIAAGLGLAAAAPRVIVQGRHQEAHCRTEYITMCRIEYETYYETECSTYEEDCEYHWQGEGDNKVWVPIPGTCKNKPHDKCKNVTKRRPRQKCIKRPKEECIRFF